MAHILAFANQKGGVGKTTTAVNLAAALGLAGQRVLLVDSDPQGNATSGVGISKKSIKTELYDVLVSGQPVEEAVTATSFRNLWVIGSSTGLAGAELELADKKGREMLLRRALEQVRERFDYILIDCPPSLGLLTIGALCAADEVVIPMQCEFYALEGLSALSQTIRLVKQRYHAKLVIGGIILTMYDGRLNLSIAVKNEIQKYFPGKIFRYTVPRNVRISEAPSHGKPIVYYDKSSKGAVAYTQLAQELIERHSKE